MCFFTHRVKRPDVRLDPDWTCLEHRSPQGPVRRAPSKSSEPRPMRPDVRPSSGRVGNRSSAPRNSVHRRRNSASEAHEEPSKPGRIYTLRIFELAACYQYIAQQVYYFLGNRPPAGAPAVVRHARVALGRVACSRGAHRGPTSPRPRLGHWAGRRGGAGLLGRWLGRWVMGE